MSLSVESQRNNSPRQVRLGEFELDLRTAELRNNGQRLTLQGQPFQVLTVLLEYPGELVTREELKKRLWPSDTFVDFDHGLNKAVNRLREALHDPAEKPHYVETIPRRGYRLIAPVRWMDSPPAEAQLPVREPGFVVQSPSIPENPAEPEFATHRLRWQHAAKLVTALIPLATGLACVTLAAILSFFLRAPLPPRVLSAAPLTSDNLPKDLVVTDGPRVYFVETMNERVLLSQVSASGGEVSRIPTPFANNFVLDVSPIRSELLITSFTGEAGFLAHGPSPLWIVPVPAGSPRRVGDLSVGVAAWSRDGQQLAYTLDRDVYLAKWDGTQSHKLVTIAGQSSDLQFSPDGRQLRLTAHDSDGSLRLWQVGVNGKGLRPLLPDSFHQDPGE